MLHSETKLANRWLILLEAVAFSGPVTGFYLYALVPLALNFSESLFRYGFARESEWTDTIYFGVSLMGGGYGLGALWWATIQYAKKANNRPIQLPRKAIAGLVTGVVTGVYLCVFMFYRDLSADAIRFGIVLWAAPVILALHLLYLHLIANHERAVALPMK